MISADRPTATLAQVDLRTTPPGDPRDKFWVGGSITEGCAEP